MLNFFGGIIKGIIAVIAGGILSVSGILSHKQADIEIGKISTAVPPAATVQATTTNAFAGEAKKKTPPAPVKTAVPPPAKPAQQPTTTAQSVPQQVQPPPVNEIDPQSIVGILCYFNTTTKNSSSGAATAGTNKAMVRGSGVIVNPDGYILTNRHIVYQGEDVGFSSNPDGTQTEIIVDYALDHCDIGTLPSGYHLPTPDEIRAINPMMRIPVLGYTAHPAFISSNDGLSKNEVDLADFAILKIDGVTQTGPLFGFSSVPSSFHYAKVMPILKYDLTGNAVVTYGFPGDITTAQKDAFQTLTMTGSVGTVSEVDYGDGYYSDIPLLVMTNMEISHGRSGSPLFWRGYVIGLTTFYMVNNRTDSGSVASDAILRSVPASYFTK